MKIKKIFVCFTLCVLMIVSCGLGLVACGKKASTLEIKFKQPPYTYTRGNVADGYDLIERESGVEYSFAYSYLTISHSGETISTEKTELKGSTIYLTEASRYTLYVTASKGEETASGETQFDVIGEEPLLLMPSISLTYNVGASVRVSILLDKISPTVIPASSELIADYYTYQEAQAPTILGMGNTNEAIKTEIDTTDPLAKINFDKLGLYEVHVIAKNGDLQTDATFKVKVLPDQSAVIPGISAYKGAEFGQNSDGSVDSSIIRLTGSTDLTQASYAVLEENFVAGQVVKIEFYGKNMPYIGLFNQDYEDVADPNSITNGGNGYVFTMERATVTHQSRLYGLNRIGNGASNLCGSSNLPEYAHEHFGFQDLEEGVHYIFEMMMKPTGGTTKNKAGVTVQKMAAYWMIYEADENLSSSSYKRIAYSSSRFADGVLSWFEVGDEVKGKLVAYSSISTDVTFKYHKDTLIDTDFDNTAYEFDFETKTLSWDEVEGANNYIVTKGDSNDDIYAVLAPSQTSIDLSGADEALEDFEVMKFNVYASVGYNAYSGKKYECVLVKRGESSENIYGTTTLKNGQGNTNDFTGVSAGYLVLSNQYQLGQNVDFYFTGDNMPQLSFLSTNATEKIHNEGSGFVLLNGSGWASSKDEYTLLKPFGYTFIAIGPNRVATKMENAADSDKYLIGKHISSSSTYEQAQENAHALSMYKLSTMPDTKFKMTVGFYKNAEGFIEMAIDVKKLDNEMWVDYYSVEVVSKVNANTDANVLGSYLIAYGAQRNANTSITFSYSEPYARPVDNTISLTNAAGGTANITDKTSGSFVLDNNYQLGEFVDIYFTGDNMPSLSFFSTKATDNLNNDGEGFIMFNGIGQANGAEYTPFKGYGYSFLFFAPTRSNLNMGNNAELSKMPIGLFTKSVSDSADEATKQEKAHPLSMYKLSTMPDTKFKMTVGFYENADGYVELSIDVKKFENGAWVDYFSATKATTFDASNDTTAWGTNLIAYGAYRNGSTKISFTFNEPYTK